MVTVATDVPGTYFCRPLQLPIVMVSRRLVPQSNAAMEGDTITVTAMANRDQMATVMIGTVTAARANMEAVSD